jgi:hypothetical protein
MYSKEVESRCESLPKVRHVAWFFLVVDWLYVELFEAEVLGIERICLLCKEEVVVEGMEGSTYR